MPGADLPPSSIAVLDRLEMFGIRMGLSSIRGLLRGFGSPERRLACVLVAGTNGKGSTSALTAAMASAAGYRTGLYTSPHLETVEERVRIDGRSIARERLEEILERVVGMAERKLGSPPTYFEALTAAAFVHFAEEEVDLAVLEVGMGGRLDATNACEPAVSVITAIGLDHGKYLGSTLAEVAREKGGILRPGRPALAWPGSPEATRALVELAADKGAHLRLGAEEARSVTTSGHCLAVTTGRGSYELALRLSGAHQRTNAALAVLAAETLAEAGWRRIDHSAIERGAAACRWPGRLEEVLIPSSGAPGGARSLILDAAHNPHAAQALARHLAEDELPYDLLFGTFADKDAAGMLPLLAEEARRVVLTRAPGARGQPAAELRELIPDHHDVRVVDEPRQALAAVLETTASQVPPRLAITGSLYLVGDLRIALRERYGQPEPAAAPLYSLP